MTFCCIGFFFFSLSVCAQQKDTTKAVRIVQHIDPNHIIEQNIDSTQQRNFITQDAAALLTENSNVYVRNYGLSNLSTLSIRGSSVAQTTVLWNGVPIQNTMLGLTDLSTVPNFFFDKMSLYTSGFQNDDGQQAIAGYLSLNNHSNFTEKREINVGLVYGNESVKNAMIGAKLGVNSKRWNASVKYYNRQGSNAYKFYNFYEKSSGEIEHSFAIQHQVLANVGYKINKSHSINFHYWRVDNSREVAPLAFENNTFRSEHNKVNRASMNHQFIAKNVTVKTSVGLTQDSFRYEDKLIKLTSLANVKNLPVNSVVTYYPDDKINFGFSYSMQLGFYEQKDRDENLQQYSGRAFYNNLDVWKQIKLNVYAEKVYTSLNQNPTNVGLRLSRPIGKQHFLFASYNTNYRIPTLNELYYFPGGNENLKPERARNLEFGGQFGFDIEYLKVQNRAVLYSRHVEDWIIWSGSAIFFPDNIAEVWSRGIENKFSVLYEKNELRFRNDILFGYNRATSEKAYFNNDQSIGKQIPYVPKTSVRNNFYVDVKDFNVQLHYSYTGYRFVTRDETEFVDPYSIWNVYGGYSFKKNNHQFQLQLKLNNLLDVNYESIRGRIMPRRNYALSILVNGKY